MKNSDAPQNYPGTAVILKTPDADPKTTGKKSNPYDSENLDQKPESDSKDITGKDIEKDLIENDPSKGFETDMNTQRSDEAQSDTFETTQPDQDNPVHKEVEIGQLGNEELKEDERTRDETGNGAPGHTNLPSENFKVLRFDAYKQTVIIGGFL